ncbi:hypothetical protein PAMA_021129 [Pampus argenteus]
MDVVAARMAMVTDSPNPSLRSRTTVTTDGDSFVSTVSLPCSHFLSASIIGVDLRGDKEFGELTLQELFGAFSLRSQ